MLNLLHEKRQHECGGQKCTTSKEGDQRRRTELHIPEQGEVDERTFSIELTQNETDTADDGD